MKPKQGIPAVLTSLCDRYIRVVVRTRLHIRNFSAGPFLLSFFIFIVTVCCSQEAGAQSMGISSSSITPDASSILELRTTTKGLLIPRMTTTERDAISSPATGLIIYNTTTNKFNFNNGSGWIVLDSGSSAVNSITGTTDRISIGGTSSDPTIDISSSYVGQSSITTLGTIGTGTWNGSLVTGTYGGTGVNNGSNTITLGGPLVTSGAFTTTFTSTATTNATIPSGTNTLYSTKNASITSAQLLNSMSDATGTGAAVFGSTPTLVTPVINGLPTGTGVASAATASTLMSRDANANSFVNNVNRGYTTTATAAGTTTLTVSSTYFQFFTGATTQTVVLPVTSTLSLGQQYAIINNSTGVVTVQSSGANTIQALVAGSSITVTCILTSGTTTASWSWDYMPPATSSNTANTLVLRDASGNISVGTITGTFSGNATTATTLATARNIYGGSFNGSADVTNIIASTYGGTGNGFTKFTGPTTAEKTFTLPNASATILTNNAAVTVAQGGTGLATLTANNVILGNGTSTPNFVAPGTSGNVLTSNGTTWQSGPPTGPLIQVSVFTSGTSATWTPNANTKFFIIEIVGGGGGGGGAKKGGGKANDVYAGSGGGGGAYIKNYISIVSGNGTYTVGAAGTAGASGGATNAGNGGNTTFTYNGITYTANGGSGGVGDAAGASTSTIGGAGGATPSSGDIKIAGGGGGPGVGVSGGGGFGGSGGSTILGPGTNSVVNSSAGKNGVQHGCGGGGGVDNGIVDRAGGAGIAGVVIIWEY